MIAHHRKALPKEVAEIYRELLTRSWKLAGPKLSSDKRRQIARALRTSTTRSP